MSDMSADRLTLDELKSGIERQQEKTRKFVFEQHKLIAEASEPNGEAAKLTKDRGLATWRLVLTAPGAGAALFAAGGAFLKLIG